MGLAMVTQIKSPLVAAKSLAARLCAILLHLIDPCPVLRGSAFTPKLPSARTGEKGRMTMKGLIMDRPLLVSSLLDHAVTYHGRVEIVSRTIEGPIHRYTYSDCAARSKKMAKALAGLGVREGDRIGTLSWNTHRHVELYYGVSGMGAICHTINPRLFPEQIAYIVNHACGAAGHARSR